MAEPEDEDIKQLVTSVLTCAMSEGVAPEEEPHPGQGAASLPPPRQPRPQPEVPQRGRSWEGLAPDDQYWQQIREARRMTARPKIKTPKPAPRRHHSWARRRSPPMRVSRGTQTRAVAIRNFPEEMTTFPVPWGRRLRSVSVGTQTGATTRAVVGGQEIIPSWDPLPEEVFAMDEVTEWSTKSSLGNSGRNLSSSRYADTTFLNIDYDECSLAALSDLASCLPTLQQQPDPAQDMALRHGSDVEVVNYSHILQVRTVATNTVHVGWRQPQGQHRTRVLSRSLALGWSSNPDTANVATQTHQELLLLF
ncbi:uncharacterized protein LOC127005920 [Eriocheir sinensis]|uniref:uncharacterized protein LOC127005920 n=1 Tax=Eriocheir sinensis TaxID=95602 RepID=UPI0021C9F4D6|nr:uncharacterized protein LOC127005920 [Eriocheir sinensis]